MKGKMDFVPQFLLETPMAKSAIEQEKQRQKDAAYVKGFNETIGTNFTTRQECDKYQDLVKFFNVKRIAVVTSRAMDFVSYVSDYYEQIKGDKSKVQNARSFVIAKGFDKLVYYHVMDVEDCAGIAFDSFVRLRSDAVEVDVFEYLKNRGVKEI